MFRSRFLLALFACGLLIHAGPSRAAAPSAAGPAGVVRLQFEAGDCTLAGKRATQQMLVTGHREDGSAIDVTGRCQFTSSRPGVARVDARGVVTPASDGTATVTARFGGRTATTPIRVMRSEENDYAFAHDVLPVLSKLSCNQMGCHGSPKGKKSLRLSLFGTEPNEDYRALTRTGANPMIDRAKPQASLLLTKALGEGKHGGGARTSADSPEYRLLADWIARGAQRGREDAPKLTRLVVLPRERMLDRAGEQPLLAMAHFSDGSSRDVTALAGFTSTDEQVATVGGQGLVQPASQFGETIIVVTFAEQTATSRILVPQPVQVSFPEMPRGNRIDELVFAKLRKLNLTPSESTTDAEFLRRLYLDVLGVLPTPKEVREFLADERPDKRDRVIDAVLERPEFVDRFTQKWCDLLRVNARFPVNLGDKAMKAYHGWVREAVGKNMPMDQFARELILARGNADTVGPANFYRVARDPQGMAEQAAALFLGMRLECAHCHSHPFEPITWDDNYGIAAFFARVKIQRGKMRQDEVVFLAERGNVRHEGTGKPVKPRFLGGEVVEIGKADPREKLATWMTSPENPWFARNLANRVWYWLMGRGIVHEPDDFRASNPPSNPELLDYLTQEFVRSHFDARKLFRLVLQSRTYQLSSRPSGVNEQDRVHFSHYRVKRLSAEQLLDAICQATEVPERFPGMPAGTRAAQLPDPSTRHAFLDAFGRPRRATGCECERSVEMHVGQSLQLINSDVIEAKLSAPGGRIARLLKATTPSGELIEDLYLATLSRPPTAEEKQQALAGLRGAGQRREKIQDLLWALLNTKEFLFNH